MKIIKEARQAWKLSSVRLAAFVSVMAGIITANQSLALGLIYFLPDGRLRIVAAVGVTIIMFVVPVFFRLTRLTKNKNIARGNDDDPEPEQN